MENVRPKPRHADSDLHYEMFWDEFKSIEESSVKISNEDVSREGIDVDAEWLSDVGFPSVFDKYHENKEINLHDHDLKVITESLTRSQAAAVRKRIESLNETIRKKRLSQNAHPKHTDVRDLFPVKTIGQSSNTETVSSSTTLSRPQPVYKVPPGEQQKAKKQTKKTDAIEQEYFASGSPSSKLRTARSTEPVFYGVSASEVALRSQGSSPVLAQSDLKIAKGGVSNPFRTKTQPPPPRRSVSEGVQLLMVRKRSDDEQEGSKSYLNDALLSPLANSKLGYGKRQIVGGMKMTETPRRQSIPILSEKETEEEMLDVPDISYRRHSSDVLSSSYPEQVSSVHSVDPIRNGVSKYSSDKLGDARNSNRAEAFDGDAKLNIGPTSNKISIFGNDTSFDPLPNFTLTREELGMTRVKDLSERDMVKVRSLALIELTALFDSYGIAVNRRKSVPKVKQKETGVFGVPLHVLAQKDENFKGNDCKAPHFVQEVFSYLEENGLKEEGLLRVPGSAQRIKLIREEIEERYCDAGFFSWNGKRATDVANILKQFLRELPIPLVTREYQNTFGSVGELQERKLQLQALNLLVLLLPTVHRDTLQLLLKFLNNVVAYEHLNKMGLNNVAMIMAPNLFFNSSTKADMESVSKAAAFTDIMRMLIKYQNILWTVPGFMVSQIRYLYEAGSKSRDPKAVRKIIAKRMRDTAGLARGKSFSGVDEIDSAEVEEGCIIRVKAPQMEKTCMAMHVYENTRAADIIAKFRWRRNSERRFSENDYLAPGLRPGISKSDPNLDKENPREYFLCEVGGNIGERRLDPLTTMLSLIKVNPNAEWILRC